MYKEAKNTIMENELEEKKTSISEDDIHDNNSFKAKCVKFLYGRKFKKAKRDFPLMDEILRDYHAKMSKLENTDSKLETMEDMFSAMMVELAIKCFNLTDVNRIKALSYLAKWLYFIDALDDLDDDIEEVVCYNLFQIGE